MRASKFQFRWPRNSRFFWALGAVVLTLGLLYSANAQFRNGRGGGGRGRGFGGGRMYGWSAEREQEQELMRKAIDPAFKDDVFTFARLKFDDDPDEYGVGRAWNDDTPNADMLVTFRLFQMTSMKVRPGVNAIDITTKQLQDFPFVYMAGGGRFDLHDEEVADLRKYLLNGGFAMVDDFWGDSQWDHFYAQLKRIFPDRSPELLDLSHPIFRSVYTFKKQPQTPSVADYYRTGQSYDHGYDYSRLGHDPRYFAIYDDKHRMVMLICHNNHYGDGWEHEGEDEGYFDLFSEPMGYPMFINIVAYITSH